MSKSIKVSTPFYLEIFKKYPNLVIPEYQRAYTWSVDKVAELLNDWEEFINTEYFEELGYYMGTILLYQNPESKQYEIIDGQQRLTTLALIYYTLYDTLLEGQNVSYNQYVSAYNIAHNQIYLQERKAQLQHLADQMILEKLQFTLIVSDSEDNAFSFFDSQNNRGVSLGVDDYLKAYHLRAMPEVNQASMATKWEAVTFEARKEEQTDLEFSHLFYQILFKSRTWRGQSYFPFENKENVLTEFQKKAIKTNSKGNYRLFPNRSNMRHQELEYKSNNRVILISKEAAGDSIDFPFSLRQPIYEGHNFFEYAFKYNKVFRLFFLKSEGQPKVIEDAMELYIKVYTSDMNLYLRHFMQLCIVAYYDSFGTESIGRAIQHFDYFVGSLRLGKYYVRKQAIKNSLKDTENNLLNVILHAYLPEEVFDFIKNEKSIDEVYSLKRYLNGEGAFLNHVVKRYSERVCDFYGKDIEALDFSKRKLWLK